METAVTKDIVVNHRTTMASNKVATTIRVALLVDEAVALAVAPVARTISAVIIGTTAVGELAMEVDVSVTTKNKIDTQLVFKLSEHISA